MVAALILLSFRNLQTILPNCAMATQQLGNDNDELAIDIPAGPEQVISAAANELAGGNSSQLAHQLLWVGSWTLLLVFNRVVLKLPPGPIFDGHLIAYYLTLLGSVLAGVAEVYFSILLRSAQDDRAYAKPLLCASVVLLAAILALGGSPIPVMIG